MLAGSQLQLLCVLVSFVNYFDASVTHLINSKFRKFSTSPSEGAVFALTGDNH